MRLRHRYLIAGIAWAALLGPVATLAITGVAVGVSWLYLFGDEPWPRAAQWVLPLVGLAAGIAVAALCIVLALDLGRRREARPAADPRREGWTVGLIATVPLLAIAAIGSGLWDDSAERSQTMVAAKRQETAFTALLAARHKITGIHVAEGKDGIFHATVRLLGHRYGAYRLDWQVNDGTYGAVLAGGTRAMELKPGPEDVPVTFRLEDLARTYRDKVLNGGSVLVDEPFRLTVLLRPALDDIQRAALPDAEQKRLRLGESPLRATDTVRFPVRFVVRRDGSIGD